MKINGQYYRTIWVQKNNDRIIRVIDQRYLPYRVVIEDLKSVENMAVAIKEMHVRGAGLIGAAAGYGMYLAALYAERDSDDSFMSSLTVAGNILKATRPTAINLSWAVDRLTNVLKSIEGIDNKIAAARQTADEIANEDAEYCQRIGQHGVSIIEEISRNKDGKPVNILTHCNAGWLAFVDYGTATAPIYAAHKCGIKVHVYVDETRPRLQGSRLTAFEMVENEIPHTIIADNTGGHLMQHCMVDMVIVGSDRTTCTGDVANKIGTYLKALAAYDNKVPFYVALSSSSIDWTIRNGLEEILIEERNSEEIKYVTGMNEKGNLQKVLVAPEVSPALNYGFDVTPSKYVKALITERGICSATEEGIMKLYPEYKIITGTVESNTYKYGSASYE